MPGAILIPLDYILGTRKLFTALRLTRDNAEKRDGRIEQGRRASHVSRHENHEIITNRVFAVERVCDIKHVWKDFVVTISVDGGVRG